MSTHAHPSTSFRTPIEEDETTNAGLIDQAREYLALRSRGLETLQAHSEGWEGFYRAYAPLIERLARARAGADCHDCVQEVWQILIARLPEFRYDPSRGRFRSWLIVLVRNIQTDRARRGRRQRAESLNAETQASLAGRELDPATAYEEARTRAWIRAVLSEIRAKVSERSYRVVYLRSIEDRPVAEIAATLNLTPAQVRARHHRVLQALRRRLMRDRN